MTAILARKRIRLLADQSTRSSDQMLDILTGATPELWRGNDVQFEVALAVGGTLLTDISNIASLTLEVKSSSNRSGDPLMTKTLDAAELTPGLSQEDWDGLDAVNAHAVVTFTGAETNIDTGADNTESTWLVIGVVTNDTPGRHITMQATTLAIVEDGTGTAGSPPSNADNYYTKGDADARYAPKHEDQAWAQWANGRWYHYISDTGLWYPEVALIQDGVPILTLGDGVANP